MRGVLGEGCEGQSWPVAPFGGELCPSGAAEEVAWDSLSPQRGWAGSQARRLHLLLQQSPPVRPPSPAKVARNPCSGLAPCEAACPTENHSPWGEILLFDQDTWYQDKIPFGAGWMLLESGSEGL